MQYPDYERGLPELLGLTESQARSRVIMLERMKARLIGEWHPVIDTLLADYKRGLRYVERMRGEDEDDELFTGEKP